MQRSSMSVILCKSDGPEGGSHYCIPLTNSLIYQVLRQSGGMLWVIDEFLDYCLVKKINK